MSTLIRTRLVRRLRAPRAGDPTPVQVLAACCCGIFAAGVAAVPTLALGSGDRVMAAAGTVVVVAAGGIPLARAAPMWRDTVGVALARERRAFEQARITRAQQHLTQARWLVVTTAAGAGLAVLGTLVATLAAIRTLPGTDPRLLPAGVLAALVGASLPGAAVWSSVRRER